MMDVSLLKAHIASGKKSHAYLFSGADDAAKKEALALFSISSLDVYIHAHSFTGIEDVRGIRRMAFLAPYNSSERLLVLLHAEGLRQEAAHAFLKILEDPPRTALFVLCAPNRFSLLPTLRSRLTEIYFGKTMDRSFVSRVFSPIAATLAEKFTELGALDEEKREAFLVEETMRLFNEFRKATNNSARERNGSRLRACLEARLLLREAVLPPRLILESALLTFYGN